MNAQREFLIERYCSANWPYIMGQIPFIAAGPSFDDWVVPGSLSRIGRHRLRPDIIEMIARLFLPTGTHDVVYQHRLLSEVLLREGVLVALWIGDRVPQEDRWNASIDRVSHELPLWIGRPIDRNPYPIEGALDEYLSGMCTVDQVRSYVSEDALELTALDPPVA